MKKILITILVVIILIFIYNQYKDYQRFHPKNSDYIISENADINYYDPAIVYKYQEAIEILNGFMIMQWTTNNIDVRNPEDDNRQTKYAVEEYNKKLAKIKYYEKKLEQSIQLKENGYSNKVIKNLVEQGISEEDHEARIKAKKFRSMLHDNIPQGVLTVGQKSAFIFEIQKLLVNKGYNLEIDGVYHVITANAIMDFETKNNLFVDGNVDEIVLDALLK